MTTAEQYTAWLRDLQANDSNPDVDNPPCLVCGCPEPTHEIGCAVFYQPGHDHHCWYCGAPLPCQWVSAQIGEPCRADDEYACLECCKVAYE